MKKILFLSLMAIASLTTVLTFTACGDDDDDTTPKQDTKVTSVNAMAIAYFNEDFLNYVDVTGTYTDVTGTQRTVNVQSTPEDVVWSNGETKVIYSLYPLKAETGTVTSFPAEFTLNITYTLKATPTDKVSVRYLFRNTITAVNGKTLVASERINRNTLSQSNEGVRADKFEDYVSKMPTTFTLNINEEGNIE